MITIAPMIAAIAAKMAPPATPRSPGSSMFPLLVELLLPLAEPEHEGHEVPVAVFVPAATGAVADEPAP